MRLSRDNRTTSENHVQDDMKRIEAEAKRLFYDQALPHADQAIAKWHLLLAAEDSLRLVASQQLGNAATTLEFRKAISLVYWQLDRSKYGLKYALDLLSQRLQSTALPDKYHDVVPAAYTAAGELLHAAMDYSSLLATFRAFEFGQFRHSVLGPTELRVEPVGNELQYVALELLLNLEGEHGSPMTKLFEWFTNPGDWPPAVDDIIATTRPSADYGIVYKFDVHLARRLSDDLPEHPGIVPSGWHFPWGNADESSRFFSALELRCIYHLIAIHFGALHHRVRGFAHESICPVIARHEITTNLAVLSGLGRRRIDDIFQWFVLGNRVQSADPALQPVIPMGRQRYLMPCLLNLSSDHHRNMLTLHARVDQKSFDDQSSAFETQMTDAILEHVSKKYSHFKPNFFVPKQKQAGEVDLAIADPVSKTLLVGELRWMLPPGDATELVRRRKACGEKAVQLQRKVDAIEQNLTETLSQRLGIRVSDAEISQWAVVGLIIIAGYGGSAHGSQPHLPLVPQRVFEFAVRSSSNLHILHAWLTSGTWLPQEPLHYRTGERTVNFRDIIVHGAGIEASRLQAYFSEHLPQSLAEFELGLKECL